MKAHLVLTSVHKGLLQFSYFLFYNNLPQSKVSKEARLILLGVDVSV